MSYSKKDTTTKLHEEKDIGTLKYETDDRLHSKLKEIPPNFHEFLLNSKMDYIEYDKENEITTVDCYPNGVWLTLYFPLNKSEKIVARLNFISTMEELKEVFLGLDDKKAIESILSEFTTRFQDTLNYIESNHYKFVFSHGTGELGWGYWDIIFNPEQFNENIIRTSVNKVEELDQYIVEKRAMYQI